MEAEEEAAAAAEAMEGEGPIRSAMGPEHRLNYLFRRFSRAQRDDQVQPIDIDNFVSKIQDAQFTEKPRKVLDELAEVAAQSCESQDPEDKEDPADYDAHQRKMREEEWPHCGICLQEFVEGETLKVLNCPASQGKPGDPSTVQHRFHQECISAWFRKKQECPLCRHSFEPEVRNIAQERRRMSSRVNFSGPDQNSQDIEERKSEDSEPHALPLRLQLHPFAR